MNVLLDLPVARSLLSGLEAHGHECVHAHEAVCTTPQTEKLRQSRVMRTGLCSLSTMVCHDSWLG
jgi:hypothetical protein